MVQDLGGALSQQLSALRWCIRPQDHESDTESKGRQADVHFNILRISVRQSVDSDSEHITLLKKQ